MPDRDNRQWILLRRPKGQLAESDFELRRGPVPQPGPGEVLTRTIYISVDAANRAWMSPVRTYIDPVEPGSVMRSMTLGEVVRSGDPSLRPGDLVEGMAGWQDFAVEPAPRLHRVEPRKPLSLILSGVGVTSLTAYFGLLEVGRPRPGETVLVSAAAGAVGSVAGQIAKIQGCRAVGLAGTDEKCRWLTHTLGFDGAINYKIADLPRALRDACPGGVDLYFDNVGGGILEAVLFQMRERGRVVCCGAVSQYDTGNPEPGPRGVPGLLVVKRLRMEGFIVMDFYARRREAEEALARWIAESRLRIREDIVDGLEGAPRALIGLLGGDNVGKRLVRVAPEPA
ncbi:MAG TPA: NADP-dependent oxidoreductase [Candidatus Methylomirabilis sp.]|nr:NADP-dependent oxidoreductase [Candidatus Methylomirabilis sp.]